MAESILLGVQSRELKGRKVRRLRKEGKIPLVLYGHGIPTQILTANRSLFEKVFSQAGSSQLVDVEKKEGSKEKQKALIHDIQRDPLTDEIIHADLLAVKMTEKIRTEIPIKIMGEAPAVKELQGNLITNKDSIEVETLPADLIPEIEVDISSLKTFDDRIKIGDIKISEKIEVLDDKEETLVFVEPPRSEEELAQLEEEVTAEEEKEAIEKIEEEAETAKEGKAEEGAEEGTLPSEEVKKPEEDKNSSSK